MYTKPLEADTRILVDKNLENLGYCLADTKTKNVFVEQPRTENERKKLHGKRPDYVIYSSNSDIDKPIIIIETKKKGENINSALQQGMEYAKILEAPIVFATDGIFCKSLHIKFNKTLLLNGQEVDEFIREALALKFLNECEINTVSQEVKYSRSELIKIFNEANNMLRGEGLRAGIDRFGEFANILFLKLISESEDIKKENGESSNLSADCHWDYIKNLPSSSRIEHINKIVLDKLNRFYETEIFTPLQTRDADTLKKIIDKLDPLKLNDVDSDIKGDAFEYFLKESTASGNDLGEYFTPRHIVKTMVRLANPQIGEKVYDPFCGTGGLLIESFRHIWNSMPRTPSTIKQLRNKTIYGNEITNTARITKMNMILAGDGHSNINMADSLANPVDNLYDVVLTNMPYSQKTKHSNKYDIPSNNGDSICVQHCIRAINGLSENGRMAIVVPEGFLFRKDLTKTREYLLDRCNLRSVISLPQGVFLPYTGVKTNIIYCDKIKNNDRKRVASKYYWYFEVKNDGYTLDNHRRKIEGDNDLEKYAEYRKLDEEQINDMLKIGFDVVPFEKIQNNDFVLMGGRYREYFIQNTKTKFYRLSDISKLIRGISFPKSAQKNTVSNEYLKIITTKAAQEYGVDEKAIIFIDIKYLKNTEKLLCKTDILISLANSLRLVGRTTYIQKEYKNTSFGAFMGLIRCNSEIALPKYVYYLLNSQKAKEFYLQVAKTTTNISNITFEDLGNFELPLPSIAEQKKIVDELDKIQESIKSAETLIENLKASGADILQNFLEKTDGLSGGGVTYLNLGKVCEVTAGQSPKGIYYNDKGNGLPFYQGKIEFSDKYMLPPTKWTTSITKIAEKDDILMSVRAPVGPVNISIEKCCIGRGLAAIRTKDDILPEYLFYVLKMQEVFIKGNGGSVFDSISKTDIEKILIPLIPLTVQKEIIAKVKDRQKLIGPLTTLVLNLRSQIQDKINILFE
jgi:type I restriction enzyme M protein